MQQPHPLILNNLKSITQYAMFFYMATIHDKPSGINSRLLKKYQELFPDEDMGTIEAPALMTPERFNGMLKKAIDTGIPIDCDKEGWSNCPPDCLI